MSELISVIIPVYNAEKYIGRCVDSILNQKYKDIEVILVNDGSKDNSGAICDEYKKSDERIRVIHQANSGAPVARNNGMDAANGDYIYFIDADDYLHPQMLEILHETIQKNNVDVAVCDYIKVYEEPVEFENINSYNCEIISNLDMLGKMANPPEFIYSHVLWNKLFKKDTIGSIRMNEEYVIDDFDFVSRVLFKCHTVALVDKEMYCYYHNNTGIMNNPTYNPKKFLAIQAWDDMAATHKKYGNEELFVKCTKCSLSILFTCIGSYGTGKVKDEKWLEYLKDQIDLKRNIYMEHSNLKNKLVIACFRKNHKLFRLIYRIIFPLWNFMNKSMTKNWRNNIIFENARIVKYYLRNKRKNNQKPKNKTINMVFLCSRANVWNSVKSVYEAAVKNENIKVYLVALPPFNNGKLDLESDFNYEFCKKIDPEVINAYNKDTKDYFDLKSLCPDYIIYSTPYQAEFPKCYSFEKTSEICELCYVSYGFSLVKSNMQKITVQPEIMSYMSHIFVCNKIIYNYYRKRMFLSEVFNGKRLYNIGFPRFDLYKNLGSVNENNIKTIMWLPRWTTAYEEKQDGNEPSSFFEVKDKILEYFKSNPEIQLIARPHPKAFDNYVEHNIMTPEDVEAYKSKIDKLDNAMLDAEPSYYEKLINTDVLVADFTSIIAEFFVTGKPIIYFGSGDNFPREHREMYNSFYHVRMWEEAETILNQLIAGNDIKKKQREQAVKNFTKKQAVNVGEHIINILTNDYYKK